MKEHPHAEVLRAIADGVPLSEFECKSTVNVDAWSSVERRAYWVLYPNEYEVRRKTQHIMVNGFKVPKPLDVFQEGEIYIPDFIAPCLVEAWVSVDFKHSALKNGCAHATKEAAIAHAKAMLGIDPEYFK